MQPEKRDAQAKHGATSISQKKSCRRHWKIEEQETGAGAGDSPGRNRRSVISWAPWERAVEDCDKTSNAACDSVGAVDKIVRNYLLKVFDKLGVSTRVELVLYCLQERQGNPVETQP